jgi:hypothetical protein
MAKLMSYLKFRFVLFLFGLVPFLRGDSAAPSGSQDVAHSSAGEDPTPTVSIEDPVPVSSS